MDRRKNKWDEHMMRIDTKSSAKSIRDNIFTGKIAGCPRRRRSNIITD